MRGGRGYRGASPVRAYHTCATSVGSNGIAVFTRVCEGQLVYVEAKASHMKALNARVKSEQRGNKV